MRKRNRSTQTILTLTTACILLQIWLETNWLLYVAVALGLAGVFSPWLSNKIHSLWMKLAWILSFIVPNTILAIIFYFVLFPLSILAKFFRNKDPLMLQDKGKGTLHQMESNYSKDFFEKPW